MKTIIKIVNKESIEFTSDKNPEFLIDCKAANLYGKRDKKLGCWRFSMSKLLTLTELAEKHFGSVEIKTETRDVNSRKLDTKRKILVGASVLNYCEHIKNSDVPRDIEFLEMINELINDMSEANKILFASERQKFEASRRPIAEQTQEPEPEPVTVKKKKKKKAPIKVERKPRARRQLSNSGVTKPEKLLANWQKAIEKDERSRLAEPVEKETWRESA